MSGLIINDPNIIGYSFLWVGRLISIHPHRKTETVPVYPPSTFTSWLHMPLDEGEVITEMYHGHAFLDRENALGVRHRPQHLVSFFGSI